MQYVLDIPDDKTAKKLLSMIEDFKKDGVKILSQNEFANGSNVPQYSDEYVQAHWREFVMMSGNQDYYKSEQYKQERGEYLMEKYK